MTVYEAFMATAAAAPDNAFLVVPPAPARAYHPHGVEFTYKETRAEVLRLRESYGAAGYGHGPRVALLLENRPQFVFHYLALNGLGCSIVPVNPDYPHDEMLYQMDHPQAVPATCVTLTATCLILPERFSPPRWWKAVAAPRAPVVHSLGVTPPLLLNQPPAPEETLHRVKFGMGAGVEPQLHEVFEKRFGFPLIEVWGMTETGRIYGDCHEPRQTSTRAFGRPFGECEPR